MNSGFNQSNNNNTAYQYTDYNQEKMLKSRGEKKSIKITGSVSGICVIAYVLLQNAVALPILFFPALADLFKNSNEFYYLFTIAASVIGLFVPFVIGGNYLKKRTGTEIYYFDAPKDGALAVLSIPMGFFACLIGNVLSGYFIAWMESIGLKLTSPDFNSPKTPSSIILYTIAIAIVPPLVEELAVRGCIMQPLRRYGDLFAIVATSVLFAVLHGNLVQAPFALFAGLAFGYICCITGSLWPTVIIHCINNAYSVLDSVLTSGAVREDKAEYIMAVTQYFFIGLGAVCTLAFFYRAYKLNYRLRKSDTVIRAGEKTAAYFLNIPMIIALIIMLAVTSQYINLMN